MFGDRLKRYSGLIKLITVLVAFIILIVGGGAYIDANIVQRETFARAKTVNFLDMMLRFGTDDESFRSDIHEHLLMFRDGGRLTTPFGPAWDYPPVKTQSFLDNLKPVIEAHDNGDWEAFRQAFRKFDRQYADMVLGRQRILVGVQYGSAAIIFFGFIGILALLFFRLGKADDEALAVRRENDHILASTKEGVFLIDKDFQIGEQKSGAVQELFGHKADVSGSFLDFIKKFVSDEDYARTEKFLGLVFGGRAKPRLMGDLNPLQNVETVVDRRIGGSIRKVLNFDFSRDEQSDTVEKLLVTVSDITKEALLREELETTQKIQDEKLALLKGVLHVEPALLNDFIGKAQQSYKDINELLEQGSINPDGNTEKLAEIARIAHRLKGDAASLRLELFQTSIHRFEDTLNELQEQNLVDGQSLVKLVVQLKNMIAELDLAGSLTSQYSLQSLSDDGAQPEAAAANDGRAERKAEMGVGDLFTYKLKSLAEAVAEREEKQVNFSVSGAQHLGEVPSFSDALREIAIQLVRNSVVHGIEEPAQRIAQGKPAFGKLHIAFERSPDQLSMAVVDDGQGLRFDKIGAKALSAGLIDETQLQQADQKALLQLIFRHGFSSRSDVGEDGGRGIGLDAVKSLVNAIGGRINVGSLAKKQAKFAVSVPLRGAPGSSS